MREAFNSKSKGENVVQETLQLVQKYQSIDKENEP